MHSPLTLRTEAGDEDLDLTEFEARAQRGEVTPETLVRIPALTQERFVPAGTLDLLPTGAWHLPLAEPSGLQRLPLLTLGVALAQALLYFFTARQGPLDVDAMVRFGAKVGPLVSDVGQVWRLATANLLHRDAVHLGLNLLIFLYVGNALESAFRRRALALLLLASGLSTMTASLLWTEAVSVGGSGWVYGCLGALVALGLEHRKVLPPRYRRLFGEAALPTVLVFLWMGWTSTGVDNAGHFGGLLAGLSLAPLLTPRFLRPSLVRARNRPLWLCTCVALTLTLLLPLLAVLYRSQWKTERDDSFGISVSLPADWRRGADRLGRWAFSNGLPGLGRATFAAEAIETGEPGEGTGPLEAFRQAGTGKVDHARVGGREAWRWRTQRDEEGQRVFLEAYFVPRGEWVYQLVFTYPEAFPAYAQVVQRMVQELRFEEPRALREARAGALLVPGAAAPLAELGETLRRWGEPAPALDVLASAIRLAPSHLEARVQLALALLQTGQVEPGCEAAKDALLYGPGDAHALEAVARCELARGNPQLALRRLEEACKAAPQDPSLRSAERALRKALRKP